MKRNTLILIGVLVVLAIATFLVMQQPGEQSAATSAGGPLVSYDSASVDKVEILSTNGAVTFERQGGKWMLTSPMRFAADEQAITSAVGKGRDLKITNHVSSNPAKQTIYAVDSTSTLVKIFANNNQLAAIRIGKPSSSWTETYARKEGSNEVYSVEGVLSATFVKNANDWRDKTIFKTEQGTITNVMFQFGDTTFTLSRKDTLRWTVDGDSANSANVSGLLASLANLQADEIVDSSITAMPKLTAILEVQGVQLRFFRRPDGKHYVQTSSSPQTYAIQEWKTGQVLKRKKEFMQ